MRPQVHGDRLTPGAPAGEQSSGERRAKIPKVLGGFELLDRIGKGGMGYVYRARQPSLDRLVALKILSPFLADEDEIVTRFHREAKAAAQLQHPNVVRIYDTGNDKGFHFFSTEYVDGCNLEQVLEREGKLPVRRAMKIARDVARAIAFAASSGIVHRDIKPANILLSNEGTTKLADLGLAKWTDLQDGSGTLTVAGQVMGTPYYMAPEQARSVKDIDPRADIYALGITFFRMLTGRIPFADADLEQGQGAAMVVLTRKVTSEVPPARDLEPAIPAELNALIMRMTRRERDTRLREPAEVVRRLDEILSGDSEQSGGDFTDEDTLDAEPADFVTPSDDDPEVTVLAADPVPPPIVTRPSSGRHRRSGKLASARLGSGRHLALRKQTSGGVRAPRGRRGSGLPVAALGAMLGAVGALVLLGFVVSGLGGVEEPTEVTDDAPRTGVEARTKLARGEGERPTVLTPGSGEQSAPEPAPSGTGATQPAAAPEPGGVGASPGVEPDPAAEPSRPPDPAPAPAEVRPPVERAPAPAKPEPEPAVEPVRPEPDDPFATQAARDALSRARVALDQGRWADGAVAIRTILPRTSRVAGGSADGSAAERQLIRLTLIVTVAEALAVREVVGPAEAIAKLREMAEEAGEAAAAGPDGPEPLVRALALILDEPSPSATLDTHMRLLLAAERLSVGALEAARHHVRQAHSRVDGRPGLVAACEKTTRAIDAVEKLREAAFVAPPPAKDDATLLAGEDRAALVAAVGEAALAPFESVVAARKALLEPFREGLDDIDEEWGKRLRAAETKLEAARGHAFLGEAASERIEALLEQVRNATLLIAEDAVLFVLDDPAVAGMLDLDGKDDDEPSYVVDAGVGLRRRDPPRDTRDLLKPPPIRIKDADAATGIEVRFVVSGDTKTIPFLAVRVAKGQVVLIGKWCAVVRDDLSAGDLDRIVAGKIPASGQIDVATASQVPLKRDKDCSLIAAFGPGPGGDQRKTTLVNVGVRTGTRRAKLRRSQLEEWPNAIRVRVGGDIALSWLIVRRR